MGLWLETVHWQQHQPQAVCVCFFVWRGSIIPTTEKGLSPKCLVKQHLLDTFKSLLSTHSMGFLLVPIDCLSARFIAQTPLLKFRCFYLRRQASPVIKTVYGDLGNWA